MNKLKKKFGRIMQRIIDAAMGNGLMQEETTASGERYVTPGSRNSSGRPARRAVSCLRTTARCRSAGRGKSLFSGAVSWTGFMWAPAAAATGSRRPRSASSRSGTGPTRR